MVGGVIMAGIGAGFIILSDFRGFLAEPLWFCNPFVYQCLFIF